MGRIAVAFHFKLALSQDDTTLSIGELAVRAGISTSAIRYYESIQLLAAPERVAGRRRYEPEAARTLAVIAAGQHAGLSLAEIRTLLEASAGDEPASDRLRAIAERKLPEIEALIDRAQAVRRWLTAATDCRCPTLEDCPLFATSAG